jgi:hypothetical protein
MSATYPNPLRAVRLRNDRIQLGLRLNRIFAPPGIIAATQCAGVEAHFLKRTRHTGAGSLVGSGAVGNKRALLGCGVLMFFRPLANLVWQHTNTAGDLAISLGIVCSRANVENDRRC